MTRTWISLAAMCAVLYAAVADTQESSAPTAPRRTAHRDLSMFAPASDCLACHNQLVAANGEDVSIGAAWRGTVMANAARDPYALASIRRETIDHPLRAGHIEDECAACHMPAAQKIARAAGLQGQIFSHLSSRAVGAGSELDDLAIDGVSCTVCHQIAPDRLGTSDTINGNFVVAPPLDAGKRRAFGPSEPDAGRRRIMHSVTGFEQAPATHVRESELCATCHTLVTEAFGPDGRVIGALPEQMTYEEWRQSAFAREQRSCQSCHMPPVKGPVRIASVLGDFRDSLSRHTFLGGNAFILRMMNRYRDEIGVEATPGELEAVARATIVQLQRDTAAIDIEQITLTKGMLTVDVVVRNSTGHKFPTGYPSRRAWLHLRVSDAGGRLVFESGRLTEAGTIDGNLSDADEGAYEPHFEVISQPDQVQIYESIMGTPAGLPTTGLLQATQYLKDNRLPPRGFDKGVASPSIAVIGKAATDSDFAGESDRVRYQIPFNGPAAATVDVELLYQPIGARWAQNLAPYKVPEAIRFVRYYNSLASDSAVVIARTMRTIVNE
jgi:hypothetical protein